jgi:transcriptional regulator with XRE-family HTH domain
MRTHIYGERDYAFGQDIATLRTAMNLTQVALAQFLGVSRGAVLGWEAGSSYPKAASLKRFIRGMKRRSLFREARGAHCAA